MLHASKNGRDCSESQPQSMPNGEILKSPLYAFWVPGGRIWSLAGMPLRGRFLNRDCPDKKAHFITPRNYRHSLVAAGHSPSWWLLAYIVYTLRTV
jgi:hypothetical protein